MINFSRIEKEAYILKNELNNSLGTKWKQNMSQRPFSLKNSVEVNNNWSYTKCISHYWFLYHL